MAQKTTEQGRYVKGFYQLDAAAVVEIPGPGQACSIQAEGGDLRVRFDGTDPTTTVGQLIVENSVCYFSGDLSRVSVIAANGTGTANVHVFGASLE